MTHVKRRIGVTRPQLSRVNDVFEADGTRAALKVVLDVAQRVRCLERARRTEIFTHGCNHRVVTALIIVDDIPH